MSEPISKHYHQTNRFLFQRVLDQESRSKDSKHKSDRLGMHILNCDSSDNKSKVVYAAKFVWSSNDKLSIRASLKPIPKNWHDEVGFIFDVSKCDRIFDELVRLGKIKIFSHNTING